MVLQKSCHSALPQRAKNPPCGSLTSSSTDADSGVLSFTRFCTSVATTSTVSSPATRRMNAKCQPRTKPIKTSVAGLSSGLPIQNASAPPIDTRWRRIPAATGAAQQEHIMPGREKIVPSSVP